MQIRCPQCRDSIDVVQDSPLLDVECPSCGSSFSLLGEASTTRYECSRPVKLGVFDLLEPVGMGACGTVWRARDAELDREVAIKIPRKEQLSPTEIEQFLREARSVAQLKHPNIVSVHEVGREDETIYIVSDFICGLTLSDWLTGQQVSPREAAELCRTIADALHHAHEQGVIHRDLKPGNIMLDAEQIPHLTDFGLAKRDTGEVTMTADGQVLGTPAYMSPEQARGDAHRADRRSDVYSLGVILFELLTGEKPFRGNTRMLLNQVLNEEPPSPRKFNTAIPRELETICLKCLQKVPERRYQTAQLLAQDLHRFLEGNKILARPTTQLERLVYWYLHNRRAATLTAGAFLIITSLLLFVWGMIGISSMSLGAVPGTPRTKGELMVMVFVFYPALFAAGYATLKDRMYGVIAGLCIGSGCTAWMLLALLQVDVGPMHLESLSPSHTDAFFHSQFISLLLVLSAVGTILFAIAFAVRIQDLHERRTRVSLPRTRG